MVELGGPLEAAVTDDALLRERGVEAGAWQRDTGLREGPHLPLKHRKNGLRLDGKCSWPLWAVIFVSIQHFVQLVPDITQDS